MALPPAPLMAVATPVVVSAIIMAIWQRGRDQVALVERARSRISEPMTRPDVLGWPLHARPVHVRLMRDISAQFSPGPRRSYHLRQKLLRQLVGLPPDEGRPILAEAHNAEH
eukprot:9487663-Pyramimonas_sp.AAC.1